MVTIDHYNALMNTLMIGSNGHHRPSGRIMIGWSPAELKMKHWSCCHWSHFINKPNKCCLEFDYECNLCMSLILSRVCLACMQPSVAGGGTCQWHPVTRWTCHWQENINADESLINNINSWQHSLFLIENHCLAIGAFQKTDILMDCKSSVLISTLNIYPQNVTCWK